MGGEFRTDISAPNLASVCIDSHTEQGSCGRLYNCYSGEQKFTDEFQLFKNMDVMMDKINYPQAAVNNRTYDISKVVLTEEIAEKLLSNERIINEKGKIATFLIHVMYRQHATWQGVVMWKEEKVSWYFKSVLELLKIMDQAIEVPA